VSASLTDAIDALLPQTQCTKCGYAGCRPYAQAIARGEADINQCPPGGTEVMRALARLLGRAEKPLDPAHGSEAPRAAALIDEGRCIGCMLCIKACPVDAIVGAPRRMHTVLTQFCTGCELCLPPCPVNCIEMVELMLLARRGNAHAAALAQQSAAQRAALARRRYGLRALRLGRAKAQPAQAPVDGGGARASTPGHDRARKQALVQAAIEKARARRVRT